jgi:hypothetical protein
MLNTLGAGRLMCSVRQTMPLGKLKKPVIVISLAIALVTVMASIFGSKRPLGVCVSSGVFSPGSVYGGPGAVFFVTNTGQHAVTLVRLEVQAASNHNWATVSQQESRLTDPTAPNRDWAGFLDVGQIRRIRCDAPENRTWRVCLDYQTEQGGLTGLLARFRIAWATRSLRLFNGGQVFAGGLARVVSPEIIP